MRRNQQIGIFDGYPDNSPLQSKVDRGATDSVTGFDGATWCNSSDIVIGLGSEKPAGNLYAFYVRIGVLNCFLRVLYYVRTKIEGKAHSKFVWFAV